MENSIVDLKGKNVVAGLFATTVVVVLLLVFAFWIEVAGQGLSDLAKTMPLVTGAVGIVNLALAFFLVWRHEDQFIVKYADDEAQHLFEIFTSIATADDSDFRQHLAFLVNDMHNRTHQGHVMERVETIDLVCQRLYRVGKFKLLILAVDQLQQIMDGAWQRRKQSVTEKQVEWLKVRDRLLAQLLLYRQQAVEALVEQHKLSL